MGWTPENDRASTAFVTSAALASYSLIAIYSAMGAYLFAFIAFTLDLDLAKRSAETPVAVATAPVGVDVGQLTRAGGSAVIDRPRPRRLLPCAAPPGSRESRSR
jgi:hypothetical protein